MNAILDYKNGRFPEAVFVDFVRRRNHALQLDVDISHMNVYLLKILVQEFKQAKFLLTLRDCYGWLDSFINFCLRSNLQEPWLQFRALRFGSKDLEYDEHELLLKQHGLYPLKGYLSYWNYHQRTVFDTCYPAARI